MTLRRGAQERKRRGARKRPPAAARAGRRPVAGAGCPRGWGCSCGGGAGGCEHRRKSPAQENDVIFIHFLIQF